MTTSRTPPVWRRAFLRELARSGSVANAARHCGIDRTTPYQLRKTNAAFAASWDRALAAAREGLRTGATPLETPACAGERAILRVPAKAGTSRRKRPRLRSDETIRSSRTGRVCIMRVAPGRWSAASEAAFLAELTATANVKAAARAAGVSTVAAYNRRKLWPAFAEQWRAAVAEGFVRIETLLVCAATNTLDPEPLPERAAEAPEMSIDQALSFYKFHAGQDGAKTRRPGRPRREPDIEEVRAEIMRKVAAIKRARLSANSQMSPAIAAPTCATADAGSFRRSRQCGPAGQD